MTAALEGGEWSAARLGRTLPPREIRYPFCRRLGGLLGRSGWAENLVPTGIRSLTVQIVAQSLYRLSYPAHKALVYGGINVELLLILDVQSCAIICISVRGIYTKSADSLMP